MVENAGADDRPPLHVQQTLEGLHAEHRRKTTTPQWAVSVATDGLARPAAIAWLSAFVAAWTITNVGASRFGFTPWDPAPFNWLQGALGFASLLAVLLVLAAQRHEDALNRHRESLSLELSLRAEQKTAKIIQLLEELRRDSPQIRDRVDPAAETMSEPADAESMMKKIQGGPNPPLAAGSE